MVSPVTETVVSGDGSNQSTDAGMTSNQDALQDLLAEYKDVFEEIQGMPPVRRHTVYHTYSRLRIATGLEAYPTAPSRPHLHGRGILCAC